MSAINFCHEHFDNHFLKRKICLENTQRQRASKRNHVTYIYILNYHVLNCPVRRFQYCTTLSEGSTEPVLGITGLKGNDT